MKFTPNTTLAASVVISSQLGEPGELLLRGIQSRFELSGGNVVRFGHVLGKDDLECIAQVAQGLFSGIGPENTLYVLPGAYENFVSTDRYELRHNLETIVRIGPPRGVFIAAAATSANPAFFGTTFDLATKATIRHNPQANAILDKLTNRRLASGLTATTAETAVSIHQPARPKPRKL